MPSANLNHSNFPFDYEIVRCRRKTLAVYVKGGRVTIRSPLKASSLWINSFLKDNTPWVMETISTQKLKQREQLVIADNAMVPFLGKPRRIQVVMARQQKAVLKDDVIYLFVQQRNGDKLEKVFHAWLLEQAREYMCTQTIKVARQLGLEHKLKDVTFRKTKTKWGHCCEDGVIQYNWLVMMAPQEVVNYLIAHETSHLRYLNHSPRFWNTVNTICPQYKQLRNWLTDNGHRFWTRAA